MSIKSMAGVKLEARGLLGCFVDFMRASIGLVCASIAFAGLLLLLLVRARSSSGR